jgi:dimethylhistidine N-methyltransferase
MRDDLKLSDFAPKNKTMLKDVIEGLRKPQKELPCKLFYDEVGSRLFEKITCLDEYYLTRTEIDIMVANIGEMAELAGPGCTIIEYGSGSSEKTKFLLDHFVSPVAYVPIDISKKHLMWSAVEVAAAYPDIEVLPVCADYGDNSFNIPTSVKKSRRRVVYFPGSTIGNFHPNEAVDFLRRIAGVCGPGGGLLVGVDLTKNPEVLVRAYDDSEGVTAAFNLNILVRINRELGADFDPVCFRHKAVFNDEESRIEMYLVSRTAQSVSVGGETFDLKSGESIWTESSYKHDIDAFAGIARLAGLGVSKVWTDDRRVFSVQYLTVLDA